MGEIRKEQDSMEITTVAQGEYLLGSSGSDGPGHLGLKTWASPHLHHMQGRGWEADVQRTLGLWKRMVRALLCSEMPPWVVLFVFFERGETPREHISRSFFNGSTLPRLPVTQKSK